MTSVVIVVGHGSSRQPLAEAGAATLALAEALRQRCPGQIIQAAFVKGGMGLEQVVAALPPHQTITVVPHFAADGLFVGAVLPEMAERCRVLGHRVSVCEPLGLHPALAGPVETAWRGLAERTGATPEVLVVGHGSPRHGNAAGAALALAGRLRERLGLEPLVRFLEQPPYLADVLTVLPAGRPVLVVSMLAGHGQHYRADLPAALGCHGPLPTDTDLCLGGGQPARVLAPLADARWMAELAEQVIRRGPCAMDVAPDTGPDGAVRAGENPSTAEGIDHRQGSRFAEV